MNTTTATLPTKLAQAIEHSAPAFEGASMLTRVFLSNAAGVRGLRHDLGKLNANSSYSTKYGTERLMVNVGSLRFVVEIKTATYKITIHWEDEDWYNPAPCWWAC
jgi:hypothetical protein